MEELLKIAEEYKGCQNVTMFIPGVNGNAKCQFTILLRKEKDECRRQSYRADGDDKEKLIQCGEILHLCQMRLAAFASSELPMGLILYGGIKRRGTGYQMYVDHYEPQNNPVTLSLYLMDAVHHLRDSR
jgi:hypothetical protein